MMSLWCTFFLLKPFFPCMNSGKPARQYRRYCCTYHLPTTWKLSVAREPTRGDIRENSNGSNDSNPQRTQPMQPLIEWRLHPELPPKHQASPGSAEKNNQSPSPISTGRSNRAFSGSRLVEVTGVRRAALARLLTMILGSALQGATMPLTAGNFEIGLLRHQTSR
jgi:hypothetical protein